MQSQLIERRDDFNTTKLIRGKASTTSWQVPIAHQTLGDEPWEWTLEIEVFPTDAFR
jgi:hypothetical protein